MSETPITSDDVLSLLTERLEVVLDVPAGSVAPDARFDEDLHADSLDLVEVVESVERTLAERGVSVSLADDELVALQTVREAADRIAASAGGADTTS